VANRLISSPNHWCLKWPRTCQSGGIRIWIWSSGRPDNESDVFGVALSTLVFSRLDARHLKRPATTTYSTMPSRTRHYDKIRFDRNSTCKCQKNSQPHRNLTRDFCQSYCCPSPEMQPVHTNCIPRTSCTSVHGGYAVVVLGNNFYISLTIQLNWTAVTTFEFISRKKLTMTTNYISGTKGLWDEQSMVRMVYTWYE